MAAQISLVSTSPNPAVLVEVGNMRNSDDAAEMETVGGRQHYAAAITQGIVAYLTQKVGGA